MDAAACRGWVLRPLLVAVQMLLRDVVLWHLARRYPRHVEIPYSPRFLRHRLQTHFLLEAIPPLSKFRAGDIRNLLEVAGLPGPNPAQVHSRPRMVWTIKAPS